MQVNYFHQSVQKRFGTILTVIMLTNTHSYKTVLMLSYAIEVWQMYEHPKLNKTMFEYNIKILNRLIKSKYKSFYSVLIPNHTKSYWSFGTLYYGLVPDRSLWYCSIIRERYMVHVSTEFQKKVRYLLLRILLNAV